MTEAGAGTTVVIRMEGTNKEAGLKIVSAIPDAVPAVGIVAGVDAIARRVWI